MVNPHLLLAALLIGLLPAALQADKEKQKRQIPVAIKLEPATSPWKKKEPLLLRVSIHNGLPAEIQYIAFGLKPDAYNGEVAGIEARIFRVREKQEPEWVFWEAPQTHSTLFAGQAHYRIPSKQKLEKIIDLRKWRIVGEWEAGTYEVSIKVKNLRIDAYTWLETTSDPIRVTVQ
jgi:hypothetical protein